MGIVLFCYILCSQVESSCPSSSQINSLILSREYILKSGYGVSITKSKLYPSLPAPRSKLHTHPSFAEFRILSFQRENTILKPCLEAEPGLRTQLVDERDKRGILVSGLIEEIDL